MESERRAEFRRNSELEELLRELNDFLAAAGELAPPRRRMPRYPVLLVLGAPRCGTTLTLQWLASCDSFAYPSNLISRFWGAPHVGGRVQRMLVDPELRFRDELLETAVLRDAAFSSDLGKTRGMLAPNEFWYLWRRFFPFGDVPRLTSTQFEDANGAGFARELAALEAVFDRPLAMKAGIASWNVADLDRLLDRVLFLHVRRHPFYAAQSLLLARERFHGSREAWYSFRPPEHNDLLELSPPEQVAGQIHHIDRALANGLRRVSPERQLTLHYEDLCRDPGRAFAQVRERLAAQGCEIDEDYVGPGGFDASNRIRLSESEACELAAACSRFCGETVVP